ncbi:TusE/DsrC/DsvC family sulfur relay protein [Methylobacter sp. YRD-M1]|uniref:TusE/DsrC/DsvC family sulfur relay protein n=1 Tax=Methylobacter sp. YRD-M1 TaxID=2911520 RepID=UPI00227CC020|nr:TusE/DsrC/DsvC family sulfur relay protein [Methylobacter sp. YRD-M1]WAK01390.1 TusE/DsrC/DsvC family sulfur relay protein [Methylobacter sp. YRD-M1]
MGLMVHGRTLEVTDQGFLVNAGDWDEEVAGRLAELDNIQLDERHWEIIRFIRDYYQQFRHLPNARVFTKAVAKALGEEKGNSRYLHKLFPEGPLKYACKLAGLPKPPTCL